MKVLILTGKFGMGHVAAAEAVADQVREHCRDAEIEIVDLMEYIYPHVYPLIYQGFKAVVNKMPRIYNAMICLDCRLEKLSLKGKLFSAEVVQSLMERCRPDVVVSTWLIGSKYVEAYKKKSGDGIPFVTCITDILAFDEWLSDTTDAYIVGGEDTRAALIAKGVDDAKIHVGGIPVRRGFGQCCRAAAPKGQEVLMMGGGLGFIPHADGLLRTLSAIPGVHTTVVTGQNKKLLRKLRGRYDRVDVLGYTEDVPRLMAEADVIVTKSGGATMFEAIWSELPLFVIKPYFEQEKVNAAYIEKNGLGRVVWEENCCGALEKFLQDAEARQAVKDHMHMLKEKLQGSGIASMIDTLAADRRQGGTNHEKRIAAAGGGYSGGVYSLCTAACSGGAAAEFYAEAPQQGVSPGREKALYHV